MQASRASVFLVRSASWLFVCVGAPALAGTLNVTVVDERGRALERAVVYALPSVAAAATEATPAASAASMDQENNAFVPHLLVVQKGTEVVFPNNDIVSHHVYSFSPAKTFELGLYKGNTHAPVLFDQAGLVVLGCNIHDGMLGYILIVDTPHFATTDESGAVAIDGMVAGRYSVNVWTPRVRPNQLPAAVDVDVADTSSGALTVTVRGKLMPDHDHVSQSLSWDRY